jgi:hypothetical protein
MMRCAGNVRYIGASNLSAWHLMKALDPERDISADDSRRTSLVPLGDARIGRLNLEEWLRRSRKVA